MKISSYTTSRNSVSLDYSLKECVESLLQFSDEVIIADSTDIEDGTKDLLNDLEKSDKRIKVYHRDLDYKAPNFGIFDGEQKAFGRLKCTGDWLFQCDNDEIVHEQDATKVRLFIKSIESITETDIFACWVLEYWGAKKFRLDINNWKERISRNKPNITHGIPSQLRTYKNNLLYALPNSTDGCNMIDKNTGSVLPVAGFMTQEMNQLRMLAVKDERYVAHYQQWFEEIMDQMPGVVHYSWYSLERKIKTYRDYWHAHWRALYGEEPSQNNFFFDKPWNEVTDEDIKLKAKELSQVGGHVFHSKFTGQKTNWMEIDRKSPVIMENWMKKNNDKF